MPWRETCFYCLWDDPSVASPWALQAETQAFKVSQTETQVFKVSQTETQVFKVSQTETQVFKVSQTETQVFKTETKVFNVS